MVLAASAEMPFGFFQAMNSGTNSDVLSIRNYGAGASVTEAYSNSQKLERITEINARSFGPSGQGCEPGALEASINSNIIGKAHIAWQSIDPWPNSKGHHVLLGRSVEDLAGVFSIQKFIQLWSNSTPGEVSVDWLPCS